MTYVDGWSHTFGLFYQIASLGLVQQSNSKIRLNSHFWLSYVWLVVVPQTNGCAFITVFTILFTHTAVVLIGNQIFRITLISVKYNKYWWTSGIINTWIISSVACSLYNWRTRHIFPSFSVASYQDPCLKHQMDRAFSVVVTIFSRNSEIRALPKHGCVFAAQTKIEVVRAYPKTRVVRIGTMKKASFLKSPSFLCMSFF